MNTVSKGETRRVLAPAPPGRTIEALPAGLLGEPLTWLFAEHYRHRQLCSLVERVGTATVLLRDEVEEALNFLRFDLPLHIIDEEDDLFPLLRRRCTAEDELGKALGALSADHREDIEAAARLIDLMERALESGDPPGGNLADRRHFKEFASRERRHIALENAVVLPIARLRLTPADLLNLARRMAARRGFAVALPAVSPGRE